MTTVLQEELGFEVYHRDLDDRYPWQEAVKVVDALGDGWRLPTKDELDQVYPKRDELDEIYQTTEECGGFGDYFYWTSAEYVAYSAWYRDFSYGDQNSFGNQNRFRVRPVRGIKQNKEGEG